MRLSHLRNIAGCGTHGRGDIHLNTKLKQEICNLSHIVAMPKPQGGGPNDVAADTLCFSLWLGQMFDQLEERLIRPKILFALIAGQLKRDDGNGKGKTKFSLKLYTKPNVISL